MIYSFYFSPAGTTAKMVNRVASGLAEGLAAHKEAATHGEEGAASQKAAGGCSVIERRFTPPHLRTPMEFQGEDIVVMGTPTYAGRVPNKIMPYIRDEVHGNGAIAIPIVTFGNRSFDSSLDELRYLLSENGFRVVAAAAFPCRHVFSETLGEDRPTDEDLAGAIDFGRRVAAKLIAAQPVELDPSGAAASGLELPRITEKDIRPYYTPLKEDGDPASFLKATPKTDKSKCYMCGSCANACPMGVIDKNDFETITGPCIKCHACVKKCLAGAKYFDDPDFLSHVKMLETNYQDPKDAVFII